jgi:hypothetical protein
VCSGCILHMYPWNSLPISLHIAMIHRGPSEDLDNSLYSAWVPVSGLIAVPLKWGEYLSGGSLLLEYRAVGGTESSPMQDVPVSGPGSEVAKPGHFYHISQLLTL